MRPAELKDADADVILSVLVDELRAQEDLESAIAELEETVLRQDLDGLEERLEGLAPHLSKLEDTLSRRERVLGRLAGQLGVSAGPGTLPSLLAYLPLSRRDEVNGVHGRVRQKAESVREANRRLRVIVSDLARLNRGMVRAAFGIESGGTTYDRRGGTDASGATSIMDRRF
jgi:tetrahydromethanopterin S-methyltransferase subunit B